MWFGTDHTVMGKNLNLLWAWPMHLVVVFFMYSKSNLIKKYFLVYAILQIFILLFWIWLPQSLNPSLIPIVLIASWRSWNIYKR